ncbi:MAG: hypothetical protein NC428_08360 [Clostridium sp.]|nr:hypothetical protein [Clostridium sp.]
MKNVILKAVVFIIVAAGTAFLVNKINNINLDKASKEMEESTLPLAYCESEGVTLNPMAGYRQVMSTSLMRDSIIPLNDGYGVDILLDDEFGYGSKYSYELRTIAGDSLVEEGELELKGSNGSKQQFFVRFRMDMQPNQEYVLVFIVEDEDGNAVRYYTRVVNTPEQHMHEFLDFAARFHETTFIKKVNENEGNMVYNRLTPTGEGSDYNLSHVSLASTYGMVTWGDLAPVIVSDLVPSVTEIDKNYAVINYSYVVESIQGEISHYYYVDEYYSLLFDEHTKEINLLGFDRYMDGIFDENYVSKSRNSLSMGISDANVEYVSSDKNTKLAFVKAGQLWFYDYNAQLLAKVFSFSDGSYSNDRTNNTNMDINIVNMDDDGNVYFAVYGYMCRGEHEGKNGISLYYYDSEKATINEKLFVECDEPFDVMRQEIGRFTYFDENEKFYYLLDGAVYVIDLKEMTQDVIVSGLTSQNIMVSDNRKVIAYPDTDEDQNVTSIIIKNFETGQEFVEAGDADDVLLALGFVGNDLIYGVSNKQDIIVSSYGEAILPLHKLYVVEPGGDILKEYSKSGIYIMDASVADEKIYLSRAVKQNNFFVSTEEDIITYKNPTEQSSINKTYYYDSYAMNILDLTFPSDIYLADTAKMVMSKGGKAENYEKFSVKTTVRDGSYYVFDDKGFFGEYRSAGKAIVAVSGNKTGVVVDEEGNIVYRALDATTYNTVADEIDEYPCTKKEDTQMVCAYMCIEYMNSGIKYEEVAAYSDWETAFKELTDGVGINISGIDLQTALYFLDRDIPFAACIDDGRYVLVISYNSTHIRYYDPIVGEEVRVSRDYFEEQLSMQGNTMYTYTSQ